MSWDAIIAKTSDPNFAKPSDDALYLPMETASAIQEKLNAALPGLKWSSTSEGHARADLLSIEISLRGKTNPNGSETPSIGISDEVEYISVSARGSGDPVSLVAAIAKANQWSVSDLQEGGWIDLNAPSRETWQQFTEYRDQIQRGAPPKSSSTGGSVAMNLTISCVVFVILALAIRHFSTKSGHGGSRPRL